MRYLFLSLFLLIISCNNDDDRGQELSFEELCSGSLSYTIGDHCSGDYLLHINNREGYLKYTEGVGYNVEFSIENTYDCVIIGVLCSGDYEEFIGTTVNVTADVYEYELQVQPNVAGKEMVALTNVNMN